MNKAQLILVTLIIIAFGSCTGNKKTTNNDDSEQTSVTVEEIMANAKHDIGNIVVVEGLCTHICSHGGKKLFLMGDDDSKTIRVESNDILGAFKSECINSIVQVKGILKEERIDESYLIKWEVQIDEGTAEKDDESCEVELQAQGQEGVNSEIERIKDFRIKIAERNKTEGKNYLSFYYIEAEEYSIL